MRLKNVPGSREVIEGSAYNILAPEQYRGKWQEFLGNGNPIHIEIGMGKGRFLMTLAALHPDGEYIGIEKYSSVLIRAVQKQEERRLPNLHFIRMDAEEIQTVFGPGEVGRIYLNFSDPWPKDRHAKRRLTSKEFLKRYEGILTPDGVLEFKTDNRKLFDFSLESAAEAGWKLQACTFDLHQEEALVRENVMTEYEERFSAEGNPICKMVITQV